MESYRVVWSPLLQAMAEKAQQRQPNEIEAEGERKPTPRRTHATSQDSQEIVDMRSNWRRRETAIRTSSLPRGNFIKA